MPFIYPTSVEMRALDPDFMARGREGRLGFDILPEENVNAAKVRFSQQDNYYGLQSLRGMDGAPTRVVPIGYRTYEYEPGVFGEYMDVTETELTNRAQNLNFNAVPIPVGDLVLERKQQLINREYDRKESSIWTLLTTGTISIKVDGPNGIQFMYNDTYAFQQFTAPISWTNLGTAVPLANVQSVQQLQVGHSVDLGASATMYMNQVTANLLLNNTNANDIGGRRGMYGATINNIGGMGSYFQAQNLPKIVVYDGGYYPTIGKFYDPTGNTPNPVASFIKFIPDRKIVVVGNRVAGQRVGRYVTTINASNGYAPGSYEYVIDRANGVNGEKRTPANLEIHRGHNGGPTIEYPSAVVVMNV